MAVDVVCGMEEVVGAAEVLWGLVGVDEAVVGLVVVVVGDVVDEGSPGGLDCVVDVAK